MDVLKNLFGNVTQGIISLAVTVGVLAAVYFFIVKPVLDTSEEISRNFSTSINESVLDGNQLQQQIQSTIRQSNAEGLRQQRLASKLQVEIRRIQKRGNIPELKRMSRCLQVAGPNLQQAVVCVRRIR